MLNTCFVHNLKDGNDPINLCNVSKFYYMEHGRIHYIKFVLTQGGGTSWKFRTVKDAEEVFSKLKSLKSQVV